MTDQRSGPFVDFRILGPLEVLSERGSVDVGGPKPRALLAALLLQPGEVVSTDKLIDVLWGERPPKSAHHLLHVYVSGLRKALEAAGGAPQRLVSTAPGYRLELDLDELDAARFERLVGVGRRLSEAGDVAGAAEALRDALGLWRGCALADFTYESFAQAEITRLEELRLAALEERLDADLALGHHREVVAELEALVAANPLRERLRAQLMLALYRCGRQAEALDAYRAARRMLVDELGIEPGPSLRELEHAILHQAPSLDAPSRSPVQAPLSRSRVRSRMTAATAAAAAVFLLVGGAGRSNDVGRAAPNAPVGPNSVAVIDPETNRVEAAVSVGRGPGPIAVGAGSVWVANTVDRTVSRIEAASRRVVATIPVGTEPTALAVAPETVWVAAGRDSMLVRIDVATNRVRDRLVIHESIGPLPAGYDRGPSGVAVGEGAVWLAHGEEVTRIDPASNAVVATIPAGGSWSGAIAVGDGAVWVAENDSLKTRRSRRGMSTGIVRIDPRSNAVTHAIPVPGLKPPITGTTLPAGALAVGEGAAWAAAAAADLVWRFDSSGDRGGRTIPGGDEPSSLAVGEGAVWVENHADQTVVKVDPYSNREVATIAIGRSTRGIAAGAGAVWVSAVR